jgi:hypothetical protein
MLTEFTRGRARDAGPGTTFMMEGVVTTCKRNLGLFTNTQITSATTGWKCGDAGGGFRQMHGVSKVQDNRVDIKVRGTYQLGINNKTPRSATRSRGARRRGLLCQDQPRLPKRDVLAAVESVGARISTCLMTPVLDVIEAGDGRSDGLGGPRRLAESR